MRADPRARAPAAVIGVMALVGVVFLGVGVQSWRVERERLATYVPVDATVVGTSIATSPGTGDDDRPTYRPVVRYSYAVGDRRYEADRVTPLKESRSGDWAQRVVARYAAGMRVTAYVDPRDPSQAFLDRRRSPLPWFFMGFSTVYLAFLGLFAAAAAGERRTA